jgi:hypothetical protein
MSGSLVQVVPQVAEPHEAILCFAQALDARLGGGGVVPGREAGRLRQALEAAGARAVLLHYANYAYAPHGCPAQLVAQLAAWRTRPGCRLFTVFHEVYATGPVYTRAFWSAGRQRRLAARLLGLSDAAATSLPLYRSLLRDLGGDAEVLPVFSTCGEPDTPPAFEERAPNLVVFGGRGARERVYGACGAGLARAVTAIGATRVVDIGASVALPSRCAGVPVDALGELPPEAVSRELLSARGGVCAHAPAFLSKSTVYAAYAVHGVAPIVVSDAPSAPEAPPHWRCDAAPPRWAELAGAARSAYASHNLARHAALHAGWLARAAKG